MEFFVRLFLIVVKLIALFINVLQTLNPLKKEKPKANALPPIENHLLTLSAQELRKRLCEGQISSLELVSAYIERIKVVNPQLNAVAQDCFEASLVQAAKVDAQIGDASDVKSLFQQQPLLGMPVTVKESCGLSGMSFAVGSLARSQLKAPADGAVVARLRAAGAIPLLVSATPEYCFSIDTDTLLNGRCCNPFDLERTPGGSSGGEGALNGAGASLFGIGSDIGGSIRIPSLFCGVFGHKPTAGVVSVEGHFPNSSNDDFNQYLVMGPITRFAVDLAQLLEIMAGTQAANKLRLHEPVDLKQLQVHYALNFEGLNGYMHLAVDEDIKTTIRMAVVHLKSQGLQVQRANLPGFRNSLEIGLGGIARLDKMDFLLTAQQPYEKVAQIRKTLWELLRSLCGQSKYTTGPLIFDLMRRSNAFMPSKQLETYQQEGQSLATDLSRLLGENGVLIFPTLHAPAFSHGATPIQLWGVDYTLIFNILGFPVTHVPMGLNDAGLPIGFSVVAAPFQDRLTIRIAVELERVFGGWQPPSPHKLVT
ncbi:CG7900 [Drosophila busckii]|uniref:CG7900 n=1 Tax=Drosophila busckii TaxID=30019 RepID=A0A0M4EH66_DROBS|nr:fatty-acid amide hydrolase 2-B [Drosophila busckii]ALC45621.1 CG7900 [Drosophila busckii]